MLGLPNDTREEMLSFLTRVSAEWEKDEPNFFEFAVTLGGRQIGAVSVALDETRREGERIYPKTGERAGEITCSRTF